MNFIGSLSNLAKSFPAFISEFHTDPVASSSSAALRSLSHSDNSHLRYQSAIQFVRAVMALGSLDPDRFQPDNRLYGKNTKFAVPPSRGARGAGLPASFGGMRWSLGRVEYATSATPNNGFIGSVPFHAKFRQCGRRQQLIAHWNSVSFKC